jgi:hypothetical protein
VRNIFAFAAHVPFMLDILLDTPYHTQLAPHDALCVVQRVVSAISCWRGSIDFLDRLFAIPTFEGRIYLNEPNRWYNGFAPLLHAYARDRRNLPLLQALVRHGADPHMVDSHGQSAYDIGCDEFREYVNVFAPKVSTSVLVADDVRCVPADAITAAAVLAWLKENATNVDSDHEAITFEDWAEMDYETIRTAMLIKAGTVWHAFLHSSLLMLLNGPRPFNPITRTPLTPTQCAYIRRWSA